MGNPWYNFELNLEIIRIQIGLSESIKIAWACRANAIWAFWKNLRVQIIPILIFKLLGQIIPVISKSNKCTMQVHAIIWNHKLRLISDQNYTQLSPILSLHYIHFHYQWKCKVKFWEQKLQNWPHNGFLCLSISFNFFGNFKLCD